MSNKQNCILIIHSEENMVWKYILTRFFYYMCDSLPKRQAFMRQLFSPAHYLYGVLPLLKALKDWKITLQLDIRIYL